MRQCIVPFALLIAIAACTPSQPPAPSDTSSNTATTAEPVAPKPEADTKVKVAFVTNNTSDFWAIAEAGTKKAAAELGCEVLFRRPATGTAQEQQQIMEDLIVNGVSGIAVSPNDPQNWTETLNGFAKQVNVITQDSDAPESQRLCYLGTNNYDAGKAAGELIKKVLPDGGKIMLFVGRIDAQNAQDRRKGIEDTLAGSNITILGTRTDETDRAKAIANVQDTLVTNPDVACLVGLWSYNGPAILNGVRDSGKLGQVKIVAFDEEPETLQGITDGHIEGTIVQQPYEFGYQSVKLLAQLAKGDKSSVPESKQIFIPVRTITKAEVDEFSKTLREQIGH
ncbi:MAG: sugar-binding protein [Candidatus Hydrogenedentes bacterium]|nr:sugar-binding protein [Candidatus Hydrogenedentota bacterium]